MNNTVLFWAVVALVTVAILAGWVFRAEPQTLGSQLAASDLPVKFMETTHVLLASRTVLLPDPATELQSRNVLPTVVNLWSRRGANLISVDDQGPYGSCTAHAMRYAWRLWKNRTNAAAVPAAPSRTFWYAESRGILREKLHLDRGSTNAASVLALRNVGMVLESAWPYTRENIFRAPLASVRHSALSNRSSQPVAFRFFQSTANTITGLRSALSQGKSILLAVLVYSSFMDRRTMQTGQIPMPNTRRERLLGGHAITLTGYDFNRAVFTFRNSWGSRVGRNGEFEIPFAYVASPSLAGDAWVV
jgi:C1A family cysteine protease